jgi:hypothetical protein
MKKRLDLGDLNEELAGLTRLDYQILQSTEGPKTAELIMRMNIALDQEDKLVRSGKIIEN